MKGIIAKKVKIGLLILSENQLKVFDDRYSLIFKAEYKEESIYIKEGQLRFKANNLEVPIKHLSKKSKADLYKFLDIANPEFLQSDNKIINT